MDGTGSCCFLSLLFKCSQSVVKLGIIEDANCKICCID